MSEMLAVEAVGLTKTFGAVCAVDDISVRVEPGEVYGVLGPNGAGKTTFLRMLFGLIRPDSGTLEVFGRSWQRDGIGVLEGVAGFIESPKFYPISGRPNLEGLALLDGGIRPGLLEEVLDVDDLTHRANEKVDGHSYVDTLATRLRSPPCLHRQGSLTRTVRGVS